MENRHNTARKTVHSKQQTKGKILRKDGNANEHSARKTADYNREKISKNNKEKQQRLTHEKNEKKKGKKKTTAYKERNHRNLCGTGWQERYARLHRNILDFKQEERYLAYTCPGTQQGCCGYGNRLRAVVSIFYLAILTDRAFLIDWLVPEPMENHLLPYQIQWNYSTPLDVCKTELEIRNHYWGTASAEKKRAEGWIIQDSHHFKNWFTGTNLTHYFDQPVEKITTIWYFAEGGIDKNPYLMNRAKQLGITPLLKPGPKYSLIKCAFDFLFQRSNAVESHLKRWREELRQTQGPTIGIHIRTGDKQFNYFAQEDDRSLNLKNASKLDAFFECAKHVEKTAFSSSKTSDVRWFLASDHETVKEYAKTNFPEKVITTNLTIQHLDILYNTTVFNETSLECNFTTGINGSVLCYNIEPFNKTAYCAKLANISNTNYTSENDTHKYTEGIIAMLVDHIILSECDFLILCDSSFSSTAVGLGIRGADMFVMGDRDCVDYRMAQKRKTMRFFRRKRSVT